MKPRERNNKRRRKHKRDKNTRKMSRRWLQEMEMKEVVVILERDEGTWRFDFVI